MPSFKRPGVYIQEVNTIQSIAQVETAIPAFVGYTEKHNNNGRDVLNRAIRISSFYEFEQIFGGTPEHIFNLSSAGATSVRLAKRRFSLDFVSPVYRLFASMKLFYANGGKDCYVVSVGAYQHQKIAQNLVKKSFRRAKISSNVSIPASQGINQNALESGIAILETQADVTMLVIPDAISLDEADCFSLQRNMLHHCGHITKNRVAIFDVFEGYSNNNSLERFRNAIENGPGAEFCAVYHPWLKTTVFDTSEISFQNLTQHSREILGKSLSSTLGSGRAMKRVDIAALTAAISGPLTKQLIKPKISADQAHRILLSISKDYAQLISAMCENVNLLPPSSAIAGVYTRVDETRGVWKAPANTRLNLVKAPAFVIDDNEQADLNAPANGKSINAIRSFIGKGILVWGARTYQGNSNDWRYISVRRMLIMIEQSLLAGLRQFVFEPNNANTWSTMINMIENFLHQLYQQGAFAGSKASDAFGVNIGLGQTMTVADIEANQIKIEVFVAPVRPAEFIVMRLVIELQGQ
ncbi:phage tail sheath family protein [Glaciecola petra]|uniref:Phage tail sheath C-terminal domain-containing protein n=1 Tax=Glaciecola petra TaxID=3075602 RepID=A0ABU2ZRX6_9ALTE|nr:phage tail sheath C-terminal domain-containing protein [Aestuariibacter sp. P117]MDT0595381.1 phage tail sheath C-terminal domain-containing protein [Aestuariibacter sp. P117]